MLYYYTVILLYDTLILLFLILFFVLIEVANCYKNCYTVIKTVIQPSTHLISPPHLRPLASCRVNAPTVIISNTPRLCSVSFCAHMRCTCRLTGRNSRDSSCLAAERLKHTPSRISCCIFCLACE